MYAQKTADVSGKSVNTQKKLVMEHHKGNRVYVEITVTM